MMTPGELAAIRHRATQRARLLHQDNRLSAAAVDNDDVPALLIEVDRLAEVDRLREGNGQPVIDAAIAMVAEWGDYERVGHRSSSSARMDQLEAAVTAYLAAKKPADPDPTPTAPTWLWDQRIPLGALTVITGAEGSGKSLTAAWLAARVTRGELPGLFADTSRTVVWINDGQDDPNMTVVPRLIAAYADTQRVERAFLSVSEDQLITLCARDDVALLVVDPLVGRANLTYFANVAAKAGVAVVATSALDSDAVMGVPASVLACRGNRLVHLKSTLGMVQPDKPYHIEPIEVESRKKVIHTARIAFLWSLWGAEGDRLAADPDGLRAGLVQTVLDTAGALVDRWTEDPTSRNFKNAVDAYRAAVPTTPATAPDDDGLRAGMATLKTRIAELQVQVDVAFTETNRYRIELEARETQVRDLADLLDKARTERDRIRDGAAIAEISWRELADANNDTIARLRRRVKRLRRRVNRWRSCARAADDVITDLARSVDQANPVLKAAAAWRAIMPAEPEPGIYSMQERALIAAVDTWRGEPAEPATQPDQPAPGEPVSPDAGTTTGTPEPQYGTGGAPIDTTQPADISVTWHPDGSASPTRPAPICGDSAEVAVSGTFKRVGPCILDHDHPGNWHQDENDCRWTLGPAGNHLPHPHVIGNWAAHADDRARLATWATATGGATPFGGAGDADAYLAGLINAEAANPVPVDRADPDGAAAGPLPHRAPTIPIVAEDATDVDPDPDDDDEWIHHDPNNSTTLTANTYPYGGAHPTDHGIQITLTRNQPGSLDTDAPYQCLRLPHPQAVALAQWILATYPDERVAAPEPIRDVHLILDEYDIPADASAADRLRTLIEQFENPEKGL
jgi:hypothetical protein